VKVRRHMQPENLETMMPVTTSASQDLSHVEESPIR
jgi:hypothetical protein